MISALFNRKVKFGLVAFAVAAVTLAATPPARADLMLTPAGVGDGFVLTKYAEAGGTGGYAYIAGAPLSDGNLAVVDFARGLLNKYADVDGQTQATILSSVGLGGVVDVARVGGKTYVSQLGGGLYEVSSSLVLTPVSIPGFAFAYGLWANTVTGHLLASAFGPTDGIYDIDPVAGTFTPIYTADFVDGVSVSPDGKTAYGATHGHVLGFDLVNPLHPQVFDYDGMGRGPDGTGVISGGLFNGYVVSNNNDGTVALIDPTGASVTIIADSGSRGDLASADSNNGTLLLSYIDEMYRLQAPGGTFGSSPVPEPATLTLCGIGGVLMAAYGWRRRKPAVAA